MRTAKQIRAYYNPNGNKRTCREIRGFDYREGLPCERTAREWREIRQAIIEAGGFVKWHHGEMWLFNSKLVFLYEVYFRDGNPLGEDHVSNEADSDEHN